MAFTVDEDVGGDGGRSTGNEDENNVNVIINIMCTWNSVSSKKKNFNYPEIRRVSITNTNFKGTILRYDFIIR